MREDEEEYEVVIEERGGFGTFLLGGDGTLGHVYVLRRLRGRFVSRWYNQIANCDGINCMVRACPSAALRVGLRAP